MGISPDAIVESMRLAIAGADTAQKPYPYWYLKGCLPDEAAAAVSALPFPAPELGGISGKRELHNKTRTYFDAENMERFDVCRAVNEAFQKPEMTDLIEHSFTTKLNGSYLRVEFAQDIEGFWLEPHTDLGVKLFTMLLYVSEEPSHADLGTDVYDANKQHAGRSPFAPNSAMVFVPSDVTYHGFEQRPIQGVRKSVIINYVTNDWRAREQLAFPETPIAA